MSYFETQKKCRVQICMYFWATFHVSIISDSCRFIPSFVSDRLSVSIRSLINQHDCFIGHKLQLLASKSDTSRSVHVFQRAISNFYILFLASVNTYKQETNLTVLFARKVFRSALKVEFTRFFIGKSYKQYQINISKTFQAGLRKKMKIQLEQFYIDNCLWFCIWYILFCINTYTFILMCVQIQFKSVSRQIGILSRNRLSNMRLKFQIS